MSTAEALSQRIKALRAARGLSLQELATKAGCTKAHVWDLETGRATNPTLRVLFGLAATFDVPLDGLVGEPPKPEDKVVKLTADVTPYSSIVGGGLMLKKLDGRAGFLVNFIGTSEGITKEETAALSEQFRWFVQTFGLAVPAR